MRPVVLFCLPMDGGDDSGGGGNDPGIVPTFGLGGLNPGTSGCEGEAETVLGCRGGSRGGGNPVRCGGRFV